MNRKNKNNEAKWLRKTYGQRVLVRPEDIEKLKSLNSTLVELWNMGIDQCNVWLALEKGNVEKKHITPISLNYWLTGVRSNPRFSAIIAGLEREMLRRLAGGFSSYFALLKNKDNEAKPPGKRNEGSFITLTWTSFDVTNDGILSASIGSKQEVKFVLGQFIMDKIKELPKGSKIAQVTVSKREGEYWANFVFNIPMPMPGPVPQKGVLAIDLGSGDIAISTSGEPVGSEFLIPTRRPDKKWNKEIAVVKERVERCKKYSRSWKRRMGARRIMHRKSLNQHTDHQRKLAVWLASQRMTIVVGKMKTRLGLSKSSGTAEQHWGVQNTGYAFRLLIFLREKAAEYGIRLIELADPARKGDTNDPESKFTASRELLKNGCEQLKIPFPSSWKRIDKPFIPG